MPAETAPLWARAERVKGAYATADAEDLDVTDVRHGSMNVWPLRSTRGRASCDRYMTTWP